jgi:hypothetical protein
MERDNDIILVSLEKQLKKPENRENNRSDAKAYFRVLDV